MPPKDRQWPIEEFKADATAPRCFGHACEYVSYKDTDGRLVFWCSKVNEDVFDIQACPFEKGFKNGVANSVCHDAMTDEGRPIMNLAQKVIIGFSVGLLLFTITLVLTQNLTWGVGVFGFRRDWLLWIPFIVVVVYFEYKLFSKRN